MASDSLGSILWNMLFESSLKRTVYENRTEIEENWLIQVLFNSSTMVSTSCINTIYFPQAVTCRPLSPLSLYGNTIIIANSHNFFYYDLNNVSSPLLLQQIDLIPNSVTYLILHS